MIFKQRENTDTFIVIGGGVEHDTPAPEVGKVYKCFDDGKIRWSRLEYFRILEAIDLDNDEVDPELLENLAAEIDSAYWLYEPEQHIIYKGMMVNKDGSIYRYKPEDEPTISYFLRTKQKEWFGSCCWLDDGLLDTDDYYYNTYVKEDE